MGRNGLPRSTVGDKLAGRSGPTLEFALTFVRVCEAEAARLGLTVDARLLDLDRWRARWEQQQRDLDAQRLQLGAGDRITEARADAGTGSVAPTGHRMTPRQLPRDVRPFVGRRAELDQLDELLGVPGRVLDE